MAKYCRTYSVPESIIMRVPEKNESVLLPKTNKFAFYLDFLVASFRFLFPEEAKRVLKFFSIALCQLAPKGWHFLLGFICIWRGRFPKGPGLSPQECLHFYQLRELEGDDEWWYFVNRGSKFTFSCHLSSNKGWKEKNFFVFRIGRQEAP